MDSKKGNPFTLRGVLFNASSGTFTHGATVELWAVAGTYDYLLTSSSTYENGEFCLVLEEHDFDALRNDIDSTGAGGTMIFLRTTVGGDTHGCRILNEKLDKDDLEDFEFPEGADMAHWFKAIPERMLLKEAPSEWPGKLLVTFRPEMPEIPQFRFVFKAIREEEETPIANHIIRTDFVINGEVVRVLSTDTTDGQGHLAVPLVMDDEFIGFIEGRDDLDVRFRLTVQGEDGDLVYGEHWFDSSSAEEEEDDDDDHGPDSFEGIVAFVRRYSLQVFEVSIPLQEEQTGEDSAEITELTSAIGLAMSPAIEAELAAKELTSLRDIRDAGFIDPEDFEDGDDKETVGILNAHAQLELTTGDIPMRHFYIDAGYRSIGIIAKSLRHDFVSAGEEYGGANELEKAKFFVAANAQYKVLNNVVTQALLGVRQKNYEGPQLGNEHGHLCKCDDCMAAVSPLAYLADLLKYTTNHIKKNKNLVSINVLQDTFKQPFGDLPASCDEMNRKLCQYRIGVEILRAYLAGKNPTTCQDTNLENAEKEYRQQAYFTLLKLMGTSFDEIRKAFAVAPNERETELRPLARRLGITYSPARTSVASLDLGADTIVIEGDHVQALLDAGRFRWTGTEANSADDVYLTIDTNTPPTYDEDDDWTTVTVVEDISGGGNLLGEVEIDTIRQLFLDPTATGGLYEITEERLELLFGLRDSNRPPLADQPMAFVLKWKLVFLREMWASEDHPLDDFTLRKRPIIDPDLIGPDDFRYPEEGQVAYDLWKERRDWMDDEVLPELKKEANHTPFGVQTGTPQFEVSTALTYAQSPLLQVVVVGSTGNDGTYTVTNESGTTISVLEPIPDETIDGTLRYMCQILVQDVTVNPSGPDEIELSEDVTGLLDAGDRIVIAGSVFTIASVDEDEIEVLESAADVVIGDSVTFSSEVAITAVTMDGGPSPASVLDRRGFNVSGNISGAGDLSGAIEFEVVGSTGNDGTYALGAVDFDNGFTNLHIGADSPSQIRSTVEDGFVQYPKIVAITGVELGHRTFVINGADLSEILSPTDSMDVENSSGNDGTYTVAQVNVSDNNTRVTVDEAIPSSTANGFLDITVPVTSVDSDPDTLVFAGNLTGFIFENSVIRIAGEEGLTVVVQSILLIDNDANTEITVEDLNGVDVNDSILLSFPISEVDIRNKYFAVAGDYRKQIFPGYKLTLAEPSPPADVFSVFTVERVMDGRVYVVESILHSVYPAFTFQRIVPIAKRKPNVMAVFQTMLDIQDGPLLNSTVHPTNYPDGTPPWTFVLPADITTPGAMDALHTMAKELRIGLNMEQNTLTVRDYLNLPVDAFLALMAIVKKDKDSTGNSANEPVTDKEWEEFFNILILAIKNNLAQDWIEMEDGTTTDPDNGNASYFDPPITLDPQIFWISLREPKPGNWPGETAVREPLIDPQLISRHELPEVTAGSAAKALLEARREHLAELLNRLYDEEEDWHSAELARYIFGSLTEADQPLKDLHEVRVALNSVTDAVVVAARAFITDELRMTEQDFSGLMGYFDRLSSQGYHPTGVDRAVYHPMLVRAYKLRRLYPVWKQEESAMGFHRLRKAQLPAWRTSVRLRGQWQDALRFRSSIPSIDPDRVRAEDFKSYNSDAFSIWGARRSGVSLFVDGLDAIPGNDNVRITGMILHAVEFTTSLPSDISWFDQLEEDEKSGIDITARLAQLTLTYPAYRRLRKLREVAALTTTDNLLPSEWDEVLSILSNVMKRRLYAEWRDEEADKDITLSQDFFKGNLMAFYDHPFQPARIQLWRLTYQERMEWQRTLLSRIENEEKMVAAHDAMVMETEELTLRILRDGLIQAAGHPDKFLGENAEDMTTRFMFDFKTTCCQRTTRVSSAIDTLQMLIWSEATGMLERGPYNFELDAPYFETEWKWIGSYATWRSAMFVFLFPENLLYPPLKRTQSPGFRKLVEDLRGNPRITPESACQAAHEYSNYWEEVCNLELHVTCNANTMVAKGNCDTRFIAREEYLHYSFAKNTKSGRIYYTVGKSRKHDEEGQGFWIPLDGYQTNVDRLLGAIPAKTRDDERFIFLMAAVNEKGEQKLAFLKFNLNTQNWDEEYQVLDLPEWADLSHGNIVIAHEEAEEDVIRVQMRPSGKDYEVTGLERHESIGFPNENETVFFDNRIDVTVGGWKNEEWYKGRLRFLPSAKDNKPVESPKILASFGPSWQSYQLYRFSGEYYVGSWTFGAYAQRIDLHHGSQHRSYDYLGALPFVTGNPPYLFLFFRDDQGTVTQSKLTLFQIRDTLKGNSVYPSVKALFGISHTNPYLHFGLFCRHHIHHVPFIHPLWATYVVGFWNMYDGSWSHVPMKALKYLDDNVSPALPHLYINGVMYWGLVQIMPQLYHMYISGNSLSRTHVMRARIQHASNVHILQGRPAGQLEDISRIAPNAGRNIQHEPSQKYRMSTCQFSNRRNGIYRFEDGIINLGNVELSGPTGSSLKRIAPGCPGPYHLPSKLTSGMLQIKKTLQIQTYTDNAAEPLEVLRAYVWEASYFAPMIVALTLQERGHYLEALEWFTTVYDYRQQDMDKRKIWHGLVVEESYASSYSLSSNWLLDPMNPHLLAGTRANSYTRYTLLAIIRCMLDFADAEFTIDTVESVSRARELYRHALGLLDAPELALKEDDCRCEDITEEIIRRIACKLSPEQLAEWLWAIRGMAEQFEEFNTCHDAKDIIDSIVDLILDNVENPGVYDIETILGNVEDEITTLHPNRFPYAIAETIEQGDVIRDRYTYAVYTDRAVQRTLLTAGSAVAEEFEQTARHITGVSKKDQKAESFLWLKSVDDSGHQTHHHGALPNADADRFDNPMSPKLSGKLGTLMILAPNSWLDLLFGRSRTEHLPPNHYFCIPDNPVISALRMRAELNLFKLRNCMNIAGMKRDLDPYAAPTDTVSGLPMIGAGGQLVLPGTVRIKPTQYRYEVIIERARQLVAHAQQMEANFLAALEKRDAEYYNRLKARQDLGISKAQVKLQDLRVKTAESEVRMAELQRDRAQLQVDELQNMIDEGLLGPEVLLLGLYMNKAALEIASIMMGGAITSLQALTTAASSSLGAAAAFGFAGGVTGLSIGKAVVDSTVAGLNAGINTTSLYASQARREQEWGYQQTMANHDIAIGNQGIAVAQSRVRVAGQEKRISELQVEHAEATLDFLSTKFTNVDLYDWMGKVLEGVYAYFLQQATATAKMAQNQLAFERQTLPPGFIMDDYWDVPTDSVAVATVGSGSADRRGMTGSARLLQDITKLDQYAFETDKRKLQITRTFSLSHLAPVEFQRFRESGVLTFMTPMELFDRDFPGHYLRLIREVRVSVIALTPSTEGIRATLTSSGVSRVVIGGDVFQGVAVRRDPEVIAFSGTRDANGLFQLQPNERFMRPFEASGVEMLWELRLPKESNQFDYGTIADVLFTIDYTALHDYAYQQQVLRTMPPFHSADMPFSFRSVLADQFYQLGHPEQVFNDEGQAMQQGEVTVSFTMGRSDFPPNLVNDSIRIREFKLYFATADGEPIGEDHLIGVQLISEETSSGSDGPIDFLDAKPIDNLVSTAAGGGGLITLRNKKPFGTWHLRVPAEISEQIRKQTITDIIMVLTFSGDYPNQQAGF